MNPLLLLLCTTALGVKASIVEQAPRAVKTDPPTETNPTAPTQTGIPRNCNKFYTTVDGDACWDVEQAFGITHEQFIKWNPAVSDDCTSGFWIEYAYCVGVGPEISTTNEPPSSTSDPSSTSTTEILTTESSTSTEPTTSIPYSTLTEPPRTSYVPVNSTVGSEWPPTATQSGQPTYCIRWKLVNAGDTCESIQTRFSSSMTKEELLAWNPALGADCSGLKIDYWVCVGIQPQTPGWGGNATTPTSYWWPPYTPPVHTTPNTTGEFIPEPTQTGIPDTCLAWHQAEEGETCQDMANEEGYLTVEDLIDFNPALGADCAGLEPGYFYCVMNGTLPLPSVETNPPAATQTGIIETCQKWYEAGHDEDCDLIVEMFQGTLTKDEFMAWNPAVGSDCLQVLNDYFYCVGVSGAGAASVTSISLPPMTSSMP